MTQVVLTKTIPQLKERLSLNIRNVDELFPGFTLGDFAIIYGSHSIASLTTLLCARAQLPFQLGGLNSNTIFIDCGNTFSNEQIFRQAKIHHLNPKQVLNNVHVSQASSAYEMTSLILERLKGIVEKYNAKIIVISDIARLFLSEDLPEEESRSVFSQVMGYLQNFVQEKKLILIITYLSRQNSSRNSYLKTVAFGKANVVISIMQTLYDRDFNLEKHPHLMLGTAEYPSENVTLTDFLF